MNKYIYLIFILLGIVVIFSCQERERNNIFDPQAENPRLDINLTVTSADTIIRLRWRRPAKISFTGYNLYRQLPGDNTFTLLAAIPDDQNTYSDSVDILDQTYRYRMTLQGFDGESVPSDPIATVPGLSTFWVIDRWLFEITEYTYDLGYEKTLKFATWLPENFALDGQGIKALVTYPQYELYEIFDTKTAETLVASSTLSQPFDVLFAPSHNAFFVTDSSGAIYRVDPENGNEDRITSQPERPTQIKLTNDQHLVVLDRSPREILIFNLQGDLQNRFNQIGNFLLNDPVYIDLDPQNDELYIIDQRDAGHVLFRYALVGGQADSLYSNADLLTVRPDPRDETVWVSEFNGSFSTLVQLSAQGFRLSELEGFSYISDFQVNPDNGHLIILDSREGKVEHLRPDFSTIGTASGIAYPYKVYIQ